LLNSYTHIITHIIPLCFFLSLPIPLFSFVGKNADVDLSLSFQDAIDKRHKFLYEEKPKKMITAKKYNKSITETIYGIGRRLSVRDADFMNIETIPRARVPVIKGIYKNANNPHSIDGSLHFDICILNNIAIANSSLIKEYSEIDSRVKSLMILIKKWTKHYSINSAQNNYLSSYTWMNLVIFYLQCIHFVPNLQCPELMDRCSVDDNNNGFQYDPINNKNHNINNLNTSYLRWKNQAERYWKRSNDIDEHYGSVSILLHGFFHFYSNEFASHLYMISIKRGGGGMNTNNLLPKTMFMDQSTSLSFCIEDPFESKFVLSSNFSLLTKSLQCLSAHPQSLPACISLSLNYINFPQYSVRFTFST
jgi:hypothetical protein